MQMYTTQVMPSIDGPQQKEIGILKNQLYKTMFIEEDMFHCFNLAFERKDMYSPTLRPCRLVPMNTRPHVLHVHTTQSSTSSLPLHGSCFFSRPRPYISRDVCK